MVKLRRGSIREGQTRTGGGDEALSLSLSLAPVLGMKPGDSALHVTRVPCSLVNRRPNAGQTAVKRWSNRDHTMVKQ